MHEPEAPAALHQEGPQDRGGDRGVRRAGPGQAHDPQGGLPVHESDGLRPHRRHARRARREYLCALSGMRAYVIFILWFG